MLRGFDDCGTDLENIKPKITGIYHVHNYLCGHAGGTVADYVKEAVDNGLEYIGISDHCVSPLGSFDPYITPQTLRSLYLPQFDFARARYGDKITILSAVEIEYFSGCDDYYRALLSDLDYLVLGEHEYICDGKRKSAYCDGRGERDIIAYFENLLEGVRSGLFAFVAHPDLIFYNRPVLTPRIIATFGEFVRTAAELGVPLELNANGIRCHNFAYPTDALVALCKKYDAPVIVSADCHSVDALCDKYTLKLFDYAIKQKLNVVRKLAR